MTTTVITISYIASLLVIIYIINKGVAEKQMLIREISKSLMAKNVVEYSDVTPEDNEDQEEIEKDEIEDVDDVDEGLLIKHLKSRYENF